jgi:3-oxoacyl-[acyl-carrier-protein] synthase-3
MAIIKYKNVGISAMSACVPSKVYSNRDLGYLIPENEIEKTISNIGIEERRIADDDVCASDLAYKAALKLLEDNNIDPESIDVLLFMSQTSDYRPLLVFCNIALDCRRILVVLT